MQAPLDTGSIVTSNTQVLTGFDFDVKIAKTQFAGKREGQLLSKSEVFSKLTKLTTNVQQLSQYVLGQKNKKTTDDVNDSQAGTTDVADNTTVGDATNFDNNSESVSDGDNAHTPDNTSEVVSDTPKNNTTTQTVTTNTLTTEQTVTSSDTTSETQSTDTADTTTENDQQDTGDTANTTDTTDTTDTTKNQTSSIISPTSVDTAIAIITENHKNDSLSYRVTDAFGNDVTELFQVTFTVGSVNAHISPIGNITPDNYTFTFTFINPITGETITQNQNFYFGILALNTDRDNYQVGQTAHLSLGVIDAEGKPVCYEADAVYPKLSVVMPDGSVQAVAVENTDTCTKLDATNTVPDYRASVTFDTPGVYEFRFIADTGAGEIETRQSITVGGDNMFTVARTAATRLYPADFAPMTAEITTHADFRGTIRERLPQYFVIRGESVSFGADSGISHGNVSVVDQGNFMEILIEDAVIPAGQTLVLNYEYDAPDVSPGFYTVGPMAFASVLGPVYFEGRSWQIANDEAGESIITGLINWYKFNDGAGTVAIDHIAPTANGTLTNGPTWSTDVPGNTSNPNPNNNSILFDGTNDYVVSANSPGLPTTDFTYTAWIKPTNTDAADKTILMASNAGSNELGIFRTAALGISVFTNNAARIANSTKKVSAGSWSHVAVTRQGTSLKLYIDGILDTTVTDSSGALAFSTCPLLIGTDADSACTGTLGDYWKGNIDDVRVYGAALSQTDIQSIYNNAFLTTGPGGVNTNLRMWYRGDMGVSTVADGVAVSGWKDQSNSANDAIQNTVASRPTYQDDAANLINFQPVVETAGNQYLYTPGVPAVNMNVYAVGRRNAGATWNTLMRGQSADHPIIVASGTGALGYYDGTTASNKTSGFTHASGDTAMIGLVTRTTGSVGYNTYNGRNGTQYSNIVDTHAGNLYALGNHQSGGRSYGDMAEVVYFSDSAHAALDRAKVEGYLGAKYGITLTDNTDADATINEVISGTVREGDYVASDGTTKMWDGVVGGTYKNNITVIGRDDASILEQKQSKSVQTTGLVTMALGSSVATTNAQNTGVFTVDKSFTSLGDDNGSIGAWTSTGAPTNYRIISRKWKVQETGTVGNVTLSVPDNSSTAATKLPPEAAKIYLITDTDNDFTTGATVTAMTYNSTAKEWRTTVDLATGASFIGFATNPQPGPGGVTSGLQQWLRADIGTNVNGSNNLTTTGGNAWADQGPSARDINFVNSDPQLVANSMNYNPAVSYDGDDWMRIDGTNATFYNGWTAGDQFSVVKAGETTGNRAFPYYIGGAGLGHHYTYSNGYIYTGYGATARKAWHPTTLTVAEGGGTTTAGYTVDVLQSRIMEQQSSAGNWQTSFDGRTQYNTNTNTVRFNSADGSVHYGAYPGLGNWLGQASEYITYNRILADYEERRVNSYNAAKYGITLQQATATDYFASDCPDPTCITGTKIWNATTANVSGTKYDDDITVIGRDDGSLLTQKQSKSINTSSLVAVSHGTSFAATNDTNTTEFDADKSFLAIASENSNATSWTVTGAPTDRRILNRKYQSQETGTVGQVRIQIPDDSSTLTSKLPIEASKVYLLTKTADANFTTGSTETLMTKVGTNWEATIDMPAGTSYFTFATQSAPTPGGVSAPTAGLVNGVQFVRYEGYDGNLADGITGTIVQRGYVNTLNNPDDYFLNDDADTFSLEFNTQLSITTAGVYEFQLPTLDDAGYLAIDGVQKISTVGGSPTSGSVTLSAGMHTIVARLSENGGGETLALYWRGTTTGLDVGTTFVAVPDNKLFTTIAGPSSWHRADAGITQTDGQNLTSWADSSDNANNLTNVAGDTPVYYTTNSSQLANYNPTVVFADDQMEGADHAQGFAFGKQGKTVISVLTKNTYNGGAGFISMIGNEATGGAFGQYSSTNDLRVDANGAAVTHPNFFQANESGMSRLTGGVFQNSNIITSNNAYVIDSGKKVTTATANTWATNANDNEDYSIGFMNDRISDGHDGKIIEMIHFPWDLTIAERQRVDSYLAAKYGITLTNDNDGDATLNETINGSIKEGDYVASNGTTIYWDYAGVGSYNKDVAVIGRDDKTALDQRQSKSVNGDDPITLSLDTTVAINNDSVVNSFASDVSYVAIGNNDSDTTIAYDTNTNFTAANINALSDRKWFVRRTNSSETITISVPSTQQFGNGTKRKLVVSTDGTFDGTGETVYDFALSGTSYVTTLTAAQLPNNAVFALGGYVAAPGGVTGVSETSDGSVANPFTSLYEASLRVTTAGVYNFNIQGQVFSTWVLPGGWALAVSGENTTDEAGYTASNAVTLQSDKVLNSGILQVLDINTVRMNRSDAATFDVTSTNSNMIARIKNNQSLSQAIGDQSAWTGTGSGNMTVGCASNNGNTWKLYMARMW